MVTGQTSWLIAAADQCRGSTDSSQKQWQQALAQSDERLPALRSMVPHDIDLAKYAVTLYPERSEAYFWLGDAYLKAGEKQQAANAFEQGLALDPTDGLTWRQLGDLYREGGDLGAAVQAYDKACFRVDQGKNGCPRAAGIYMQQGQYDLAAQRYRQSLEQLPNWHPAQKGLAEALLAMGRQDEAVPFLEVLAENGDAEAAQMLDLIKSGNN